MEKERKEAIYICCTADLNTSSLQHALLLCDELGVAAH